MTSYQGGYQKPDPEELRLWVKRHTELRCWLCSHYGFSNEDARSAATRLLGLFPLLKERFYHFFSTGELRDDLRICGWSIGEIQSHTNHSLPDLFEYFQTAFTIPWAWRKQEGVRSHRIKPDIDDLFSQLGWKEEEEYFPSFNERLEWFKTHEHNSRFDSEIYAHDLGSLVRPLMERFRDWWLTGELRDDLVVYGWSLGRFLSTYITAVPTAFVEFQRFFMNFQITKGRLEEYEMMAKDPNLYRNFAKSLRG